MTPLFDRRQLDEAMDVVHARMPATPQYAWPLLERRAGCRIWVKHENHTPTGAFKLRGGLVYLDDLARRGPCRGIVTATRGNHGQSIPFAARLHGIPVRVYVPRGNSAEKNRAMAAWGADLRVFGADFEEARLEAVRVARLEGLHAIGPFHELLVRGVATYALELFSACADLDRVYVPIGMGSGIVATITVRDLLGLKTEIVGVVAQSADSYARSFENGAVTPTDSADTFADGLACRVPWQQPLDIIRAGAADVVRVSDDQIAEAMRIYHADTHNIAEGAGAAALAAALNDAPALAGRQVAVILTGGNVDRAWFADVLAGKTPRVHGG